MLLRTEDDSPLEKLTPGTHKKVWFSCEQCNVEVLQAYRNYIKQGELKLCRPCRNKHSGNLPETKAKHSVNGKKNWQDPTYREKTGKSISKARKAAWDKVPVEERIAPNRIPYDKVKALFESERYMLLTPKAEYKAGQLLAQCPAGHIYETSYTYFNSGSRCVYCFGIKVDYDNIRKALEGEGFKINNMSEDEFDITCSSGHNTKLTLDQYRRNVRCTFCSKYHYDFNNIKIELKKLGYTVKGRPENWSGSKNTEIQVECSFGHVFNTYYGKNIKCAECIKIEKYNKFKKSMEDQGYKLLTSMNDFYTLKNKKDPRIKFICSNGHRSKMYINNWLNGQGCGKCTLGGTSKAEKDIGLFLSKHIKTQNGSKKIIPPYQLDIFVPEHNLAVEYNGIYYHSEKSGIPNDYHLNKTTLCKDKEIQLIHIFEDEWNNKQDIVRSMLLNKLGLVENKIYARKCTIREIEAKIKDGFLKENHIQGHCVSSVNLGLFHEEELVSVMTFGKRKITGQEAKDELLRFCNKLNTSVVGGASRMFKFYIDAYSPDEIVSYADKRWFSGKMYEALGFKLDHESAPNYWYIVQGRREHRVKYQKHKLPALLENFDDAKTEWQNMQDHGYDRIWDCGNMVYEWRPVDNFTD